MGRIRLAIIGSGAVLRRHHLPVLINNPNIEIIAICDKNIDAVRNVMKRFRLNCHVFQNPEDIFSIKDVNVIDICTPGNTHYFLSKQALENGKHVLVEKPPVMKVEEAELLIEMAAAKGLKIGTIFNYRYKEVLCRLRQKIDSGILGRVTKIYVLHHANLVYGDSPWLWNEKESKYLVYEFGIHFFDFIISILGEHESVISVIPFYQPTIKQTTEIQVAIQFCSGAYAYVTIAQDTTRHSTHKTIIDVYGTARDAHIRFFPPLLRLSSGLEYPLDLLFSEFKSFSKLLWLILNGKWRDYQNQGHLFSLNKYIDWILEDKYYPFNLKSVLPTLRLLDEISSKIPSYNA